MPSHVSWFAYRDTSSSFIEITTTAPQLVHHASRGKAGWGEVRDEERPWRQSRRGEAVPFWSISLVQGTLQGQEATVSTYGRGNRASWAQNICRRRSAMTKASFMTILKPWRISWVRSSIKSHRQVQSVAAFVKLWKLPPSPWEWEQFSTTSLFLEHNCLNCQFGHNSWAVKTIWRSATSNSFLPFPISGSLSDAPSYTCILSSLPIPRGLRQNAAK